MPRLPVSSQIPLLCTMSSGLCQLEIKTLKGEKIVVSNVSVTETIEDLYKRVDQVESTPKGKWKIMVVTPTGSVRTLKWDNKDDQLCNYGVKESSLQYRIEVVLDMGACHMSRR